RLAVGVGLVAIGDHEQEVVRCQGGAGGLADERAARGLRRGGGVGGLVAAQDHLDALDRALLAGRLAQAADLGLLPALGRKARLVPRGLDRADGATLLLAAGEQRGDRERGDERLRECLHRGFLVAPAPVLVLAVALAEFL